MVVTYIVVTYIVMAYIAMVYMVMTYIVVAYIVMACIGTREAAATTKTLSMTESAPLVRRHQGAERTSCQKG